MPRLPRLLACQWRIDPRTYFSMRPRCFSCERLIPADESGTGVLHNIGSRKGKVLDEQFAAVFELWAEKICRLDTPLSDVPMMEACLA